jgi:subtilisin family serine protease
MKNSFLCCLAALLALLPAASKSQTDVFRLDERVYKLVHSDWYLCKDGVPAARIDRGFVVFKLRNNERLTRQHLESLHIDSLVEIKTCITNEYWLVKVRDRNNAFRVAEELQRSSFAEEVQFDVLFEPHKTDDLDDQYFRQWHLPKTKVDKAWDITTGDSSVIVAIIDGGAQYDHQDLDRNRNQDRLGYDFTDDTAYCKLLPFEKHATCVAGLIAAGSNDGGVAGVAGGWWSSGNFIPGCRLMYFRCAARDTGGNVIANISPTLAAIAVDSAAAWGARVISMSFGHLSIDVTTLRNAINNAVANHAVVVVASAGNDQQDSICYPAKYGNVIAVGATDSSDCIVENIPIPGDGTWGSNRGPEMDLMAPGLTITTTDRYNSDSEDTLGYTKNSPYAIFSFGGTSASAPIVAGTAALILSMNKDLSPSQVRKTLCLSADKVAGMGNEDSTKYYANGRLNAYHAVRNLYVPDVYINPDSACQHMHWGQAMVLQKNTGTHTLAHAAILGSNQYIEVHPGDTLVIQDTLDVDTLSYIRLISDANSQAAVVFGAQGCLMLHSPMSLSGQGIVKNAHIRWTSDYQLGVEDSLVFQDGGTLTFGPSPCMMNINGAMVFDSGTFIIEENVRTIYVNSNESAKPAMFLTLPGATLDGIPGIQAYESSLVKSQGTSDTQCSWRFRQRAGDRYHAGFDTYNVFEAEYTTFRGSVRQQDSCLWGGIFVGGVHSSIMMDRCTVQDIFIDSLLHGTAIHLYGSTNRGNRISHCRIYRENRDNPFAGDGIILQANGADRSYAVLDSNCISERWWTGDINVSSDEEMKGNKVYDNYVGSSTILNAESYHHANCITHNAAQGLEVENTAKLTLQAMSGAPAGGDNTIGYNGWIDPGAFQIHRAQIVLLDNAMVNDAFPDSVDQNNSISSDTVKLVYAAGGSQANLRKNWWGFMPEGCNGGYGNISQAADSMYFYNDGSCLLIYDNALCDSTTVPEYSEGCGETLGMALASGQINRFTAIPPWWLARSQPSPILSVRSALQLFRLSLLSGNATSAYSMLATLLQAYSNDPDVACIIATSALHSELDYSSLYPSLLITSMTRIGAALNAALNNTTNDAVRAVLREALCHVLASAGDIPSAERMIGTLLSMQNAGAPARRVLWLELLCAMARRDTLAVDATIGDLASAGYSTGRLHTAYAMREGFLRFRSRPAAFPRLSFSPIDTLDGRDHRALISSLLELQVYPNPAANAATIRYVLPIDGAVSLTICSIIGIPVLTVTEGYQYAGVHRVEFRTSGTPRSIPPGLYFCSLRTEAGQRTATILIR